MRKAMLVAALVAVFVLAFAPVAMAAEIEGNDRDNYLRETCGDDTLRGKGGNDTLDANNCGPDRDVLRGGGGNDRLLANDGDTQDRLRGGPGFDTCVVDARSEVVGGCERILVRGPSA